MGLSPSISVEEFDCGQAICGSFPEYIPEAAPFELAIADPPYGNIVKDGWDQFYSEESAVEWMLEWTDQIGKLLLPNAALYVWGGVGIPGFRPLYSFLSQVEKKTRFLIANHITWSKKRAYGITHNYLFTREELIYLINGTDVKNPRYFNIPLLDEKRGYPGYSKKYPAKSEFKRRTNVWTDITEILRGKIHTAQKPVKLHEILIETHTKPGECVFDPFAGSGTTAIAAIKNNRKFVVMERDPEIYQGMVERIQEELRKR
jgi:DNA modification methylase